MPEFSGTIISLFHTTREAPEQGGLLTGKDPSAFNTVDPLRLWIIQVGVIIGTTQLLALGLRKIRQPKVIAEVIGGIILGPTAFGHIPGFTEHIFPIDSRPYISLVANIGLVLFLFLIGLEIDSAVIKRNARLSATVALAGMILPFGLGAGLAVPLYHHFIDSSILFTHFMLFAGVAFSITAFPVLCRILTELKLLDTTVGIVVLSAGVANDIIGWTLLALSVALVNAGSGLTALWILMICVGWTLLILFPAKIALLWLARHTGSVENGPTMFFMTMTILLVFGSAFFTDVIGVHAIFGAFLVGIIVPRDGGLAITLTEKLEDMVSIIFLPLYFTLTGLSTNLGLLNNGITWAFTVTVCVLAFFGKFGGCTVAARYSGFSWREASTIGSLMSCKGLVELIVLNVGLSAGILSQRVFSMFVLEALLLTVITTPLVSALYPLEKRTHVAASGANFHNVADNEPRPRSGSRHDDGDNHLKKRFTVVLDKIDHLPGMMALTQLLHRAPFHAHSDFVAKSPIPLRLTSESFIDALRLIELSDRTSAVMKSSVADTLLLTDPLLAIFKMFGELHGLPISTSLSIVPYGDLAQSVADHARKHASQLILVPWLPPSFSNMTETNPNDALTTPKATATNPFDALFRTSHTTKEKSAHAVHAQFIRQVFSQSETDVALFIDQGHAPGAINAQHIFLPFFGGPDDRLALEFVVQLTANSNVSASIVKIVKDVEEAFSNVQPAHLGSEKIVGGSEIPDYGLTGTSATGIPDTVYDHANTQTRLQSETADNVMWARFANHPSPGKDEPLTPLTSALARIQFSNIVTPIPLHVILQQVASQVEHRPRVLVVVGRSRRLAVEDHHHELQQLMEEYGNVGNEVKKTIGDVATAFLVGGREAGIIVLQAANMHLD